MHPCATVTAKIESSLTKHGDVEDLSSILMEKKGEEEKKVRLKKKIEVQNRRRSGMQVGMTDDFSVSSSVRSPGSLTEKSEKRPNSRSGSPVHPDEGNITSRAFR